MTKPDFPRASDAPASPDSGAGEDKAAKEAKKKGDRVNALARLESMMFRDWEKAVQDQLTQQTPEKWGYDTHAIVTALPIREIAYAISSACETCRRDIMPSNKQARDALAELRLALNDVSKKLMALRGAGYIHLDDRLQSSPIARGRSLQSFMRDFAGLGYEANQALQYFSERVKAGHPRAGMTALITAMRVVLIRCSIEPNASATGPMMMLCSMALNMQDVWKIMGCPNNPTPLIGRQLGKPVPQSMLNFWEQFFSS